MCHNRFVRAPAAVASGRGVAPLEPLFGARAGTRQQPRIQLPTLDGVWSWTKLGEVPKSVLLRPIGRNGTVVSLRVLLLVAVALGLKHRQAGWADEVARGGCAHGPWNEEDLDKAVKKDVAALVDDVVAAVTEAPSPAGRNFMQAGSIYQNAYLTLRSVNMVPISVTVHVHEGDRFELRIDHLNSVGGGSEAWIAVQGYFRLEPLPNVPGRLRLAPEPQDGAKPFDYDPAKFDRAVALAFKLLERLPTHRMLQALRLEVDVEQNTLLVTPVAQVVRMLWAKPVVLHLSPGGEAGLWGRGEAAGQAGEAGEEAAEVSGEAGDELEASHFSSGEPKDRVVRHLVAGN